MSLRLCPGCSRHVREELCPFCGTTVAPAAEGAGLPRVARIALLGAAAAAVATACSSSPAPMYGGPPNDASNDGNTIDAVPFYGGPPIEAGGTDAEPDASDSGSSDAAGD